MKNAEERFSAENRTKYRALSNEIDEKYSAGFSKFVEVQKVFAQKFGFTILKKKIIFINREAAKIFILAASFFIYGYYEKPIELDCLTISSICMSFTSASVSV